MEKPVVNPYLAVMVGVLAVSFSSLLVKISSAPPIIIAAYRLFFTFLVLAPLALAKERAEIAGLSWRDKGLAALSGLFLALHFITWFTSLNYTSVASSVVIVTTQPLWVVLGSYFLYRETVPTQALLGGALALAGSIYIGATDLKLGYDAFWGDLLALVGAWMVSGYFLIGRGLRSRISLQAYTFYTYGASSLVLIMAGLLGGLSFFPYPLQDWLAFWGLALICTIMGHTVFNWALRYVQASVVTIGVLGEPVGAVIWAYLFLGEAPTARQLAGGMVILAGLYIFLRASAGKGRERKPGLSQHGQPPAKPEQ